MTVMAPPMEVLPAARREWFLEFQHWLVLEFDSSFSLTPFADWAPGSSELEWRAFARTAAGREVSAALPHNFAWFRPQPVARSIVARLLDQVIQSSEPVAPVAAHRRRSSGRRHERLT